MDSFVRYLRSDTIADFVSLIALAAIFIVALGNLVLMRIVEVKPRIPKV
jgi:hypothetical protein